MIKKESIIKLSKYTKDFSWGFYCTTLENQAKRWATHHGTNGYINLFEFTLNPQLKILQFSEINDEWLDLIAHCEAGNIHSYDIVEGPIADDTIYNYVERYLNGRISKEEFLMLAKFKHPTHQISFHSVAALKCLKYLKTLEVPYEH